MVLGEMSFLGLFSPFCMSFVSQLTCLSASCCASGRSVAEVRWVAVRWKCTTEADGEAGTGEETYLEKSKGLPMVGQSSWPAVTLVLTLFHIYHELLGLPCHQEA